MIALLIVDNQARTENEIKAQMRWFILGAFELFHLLRFKVILLI